MTAAQRGMSLQMAFSLKKMTSRMAKIRQERRSPVTEAYYNGNYQVGLSSQAGSNRTQNMACKGSVRPLWRIGRLLGRPT